MAQPYTLKLGSLDLSNYLRVSKDEGFDPYDGSGFVEPQFGESPFAEGQPLVSADIQNRELSWPLHLNAATKDAAHALVTSINNEIVNNKQLRVEWKDQGASNSTFYDVGFARFDPEFNYRRAANNWESGTLRIWCSPPFGHTATARPLASMATTGIARVVPIPAASPILGDAPPLLDVFVRTCGSGQYPESGRVVGYVPLPHPSYAGIIPAASMVAGVGASIVAASGAQGGNVITFAENSIGQGFGYGRVGLSPASVYAGGRHRVLAIARSAQTPVGMPMRAAIAGIPIGPTAVATGRDWCIVDLGVFSVPSNVRVPTLSIDIGYGDYLVDTVGTGQALSAPDLNTATALNAGGISAMMVVPDDYLRMVLDSPRSIVDAFGGLMIGAASGSPASGMYDPLGNQWTSPTYVGTSPAHGLVPGYLAGVGGVGSGFGVLLNHAPVSDMRMTAHVNAGIGPSGAFALRKQFIPGASNMFPYFTGLHMKTSISILQFDGAATSLLASVAVASSNELTRRFDFGMRGQSVYFSMNSDAFTDLGKLASIGVTATNSFPADRPGRGAVLFSTGSTSGRSLLIGGVNVESMASAGIGSRDGYEFSDYGAIQRQDSASVFNADVTGMGRGAGLPPTSPSQVAAVLAFACPLEGGSGTDLIDINVSVRERFRFAR